MLSRDSAISASAHSRVSLAHRAPRFHLATASLRLYRDDPSCVKAGDGNRWVDSNAPPAGHVWNFYATPAQYMRGGETWERSGTANQGCAGEESDREGRYGILGPDERNSTADATSGRYMRRVFTPMILAMPYHYIPPYQR